MMCKQRLTEIGVHFDWWRSRNSFWVKFIANLVVDAMPRHDRCFQWQLQKNEKNTTLQITPFILLYCLLLPLFFCHISRWSLFRFLTRVSVLEASVTPPPEQNILWILAIFRPPHTRKILQSKANAGHRSRVSPPTFTLPSDGPHLPTTLAR